MSHPARRPRPHGAPQSFPLPHTCPRALAHACACGARGRCARVCSTTLACPGCWRVWVPQKKTLNTPAAARGCSTPGWAVRVHTQPVCSARHTRGTQPDTRGCCVHSSPPAPAPSQPMVGQRLPPCPRQPRGLPGSPSLAGSRGQRSPACMGGDITGVAGPAHPPGPPPAGAEVAAGTEQQQELRWEPALLTQGVPAWLPALGSNRDPKSPFSRPFGESPKSISQPRCGRGHGLSSPLQLASTG